MTWKPIDEAPHDGREIVVGYRQLPAGDIIVAVSSFTDGLWIRRESGDTGSAGGDVPFAWTEKPE